MAEGTTKVFSPSMLLVLDKLFRLTLITNNCRFWQVIPAGGNLFEVRSRSKGFTVDEGKRTCSFMMWQLSGIPCVHAIKVIFLINRVPESYVPAWFETYMYFVAYHNFVKPVLGINLWPDQSMYSIILPAKPRKMSGRPRKKRIRAIEDVDVVLRGPVRDEGAGGSRGGGASGSRGGASGSRGSASVSRGGAGGSRGGAGGSRGGASRSKRKPVSSVGTQKRQGKKKVETFGFAKWFGLQNELKQTQDEPQQAQHEPVQTQDEDQVEQTQEQAVIDLTQSGILAELTHRQHHVRCQVNADYIIIRNILPSATEGVKQVPRSRMTCPTPDLVTPANRVSRNDDNPDDSPSLQDQILEQMSSLKALIKHHNNRVGTLVEPIRLTFGDEEVVKARTDGKGVEEKEEKELQMPYKEVLKSRLPSESLSSRSVGYP
ncbi:multidrug resistance-associated protein 5 [Tanacetum coccineum]